MAKLNVPYPLCPLIDQRSLLGVSQDAANDCVIVTLGKNIVIRYKLQDQKQVSSWSSKDKLSCPVIFNEKSKQYVAVYNHNQMRLWIEGEEQFDQVKKLKFERRIHCVLPQSDGELPIVVFQDGSISLLDVALQNRKNPTSGMADHANQLIQECQLVVYKGNKFVTYLTMSQTRTCYNIASLSQTGNNVRMDLTRPKNRLIGHIVLQEETADMCSLYTLWSDGKLFCADMFGETPSHLPGTVVQTISDISTAHMVAMTPLSDHHIAMYGAQVSEEGALLVIYNTQYHLVQAKQKSKLFGISPRLWCIGNNLFFASGNYLAVVPFHLDVTRLAALVGSHQAEDGQFEQVTWGEGKKMHSYTNIPPSIEGQLIELTMKGWPQFTIFQELLPDLLGKKDLATVLWCLRNISDIPEVSLATLLNFCLSENDSTFDTIVVDEDKCVSQSLLTAKQKFIDCILNVPFGDVYLLPHLRLLSFTNTLLLLRHLLDKLSQYDIKSLQWLGLLLDSHYQQYLLSKDPQVLEILNSLCFLVNSQLEDLEEFKKLAPLVQRLSVGKPLLKPSQMGDNSYSVEVLYLY